MHIIAGSTSGRHTWTTAVVLAFIVSSCGAPQPAPPSTTQLASAPIDAGPGERDPVVANVPANRAAIAPRSHVPVQLGASDRACSNAAGCRVGEVCLAPEEQRWNFCGAPRRATCAPGEIADECSGCFLSCGAQACPSGFTCNGSYCISPRRCVPETPMPPSAAPSRAADRE